MSDLELKTELIHFADHFMILATEQRDKMPEISYQAFRLSEICRKAAENLQQDPMEAELEGGGSTWWYVCGECRTAIDTKDKFCRECGRRIIWGNINQKKKEDFWEEQCRDCELTDSEKTDGGCQLCKQR